MAASLLLSRGRPGRTGGAGSVAAAGLHSAKGLAFSYVFIAALHTLPMTRTPLEDERRLLHVGMTRATRSLAFSASGASVIVERVRNSLGRVGRQFASLAEDR